MTEPGAAGTVTLLDVNGVSKRFGGVQAVSDVSLSVEAGEIVGVIGPNGAGKSTLLELLSGSKSPDSGTLSFRGSDITGYSGYAVSRLGIARTFQKLRPFPAMTVIDNVMVGALVHEKRLRKAREVAMECIDFVGLSHKVDALANTLSTGQRKRLELARVMAKRPAIYLLDEVMAGVDQRSIGGLVELVASLRDQGSAIVIIEHNLAVLRKLCTRLMAMHLGKRIAVGTPEEVLQNETVVKAYVGE